MCSNMLSYNSLAAEGSARIGCFGGTQFAFVWVWSLSTIPMRCYIWGSNNHEDRTQEGRGVSCFAIPDWGLQFRAVQDGNASTCEAAALIGLLRFVENNPKVFEGERVEVLTDASQLVEQLTGKLAVDPSMTKTIAIILSFRQRIRFELTWVPPNQNRAIEGVLDLPPLQTKFQIQHSAAIKKSADHPFRRFNT